MKNMKIFEEIYDFFFDYLTLLTLSDLHFLNLCSFLILWLSVQVLIYFRGQSATFIFYMNTLCVLRYDGFHLDWLVDVYPKSQRVNENQYSEIKCLVNDSVPLSLIRWRKEGGRLPKGASIAKGVLSIPKTKYWDGGNYVCYFADPSDNQEIVSPKAEVIVQRRTYLPLRSVYRYFRSVFIAQIAFILSQL